MASPFDVLGVDPGADDETIEQAYRERVFEAHPDHGGSAAEFQRIRRAYERIENGYDPSENGATPAPGDEGDAEPDDPAVGVTVEYLDYQALADQGWELTDADLFEKAVDTDLDEADYGTFVAEPGTPLLEAAEEAGHAWPFACRGGACTNCAVAVIDGEMPMHSSHILPQEWIDRGIRLSCVSAPVSDGMQVVFNVKHLPGLEELLLPASRFDKARSSGD
ncbi:ferredoxin Fer [Haloglomus halophilum]|uniref:ferredoxin Fer n=1 Tax=Haloglomus halophilum TaxID=2962672 RepID=UPI0020CA0C66|nr:ferredoxin Fer [Haloglomus halophilum]